ncbi:MAG: dephospho-CoA kinase [Sphingomicrobium sp.]
MKKIALTGSIGMGKSTVAEMFAARGVPVFDADAEVRKLQAPGGALVAPIATRFPDAMRAGQIDRDMLAVLVLADRDELSALEMIVHPKVAERREDFIRDHHASPILLFDIPLLFESGGERMFDAVIVASAPTEVQRARVLARPGMTPDKFERILARQTPDRIKREQADFVVDTGGSLAHTEAEVERILACLSP